MGQKRSQESESRIQEAGGVGNTFTIRPFCSEVIGVKGDQGVSIKERVSRGTLTTDYRLTDQ